MKINKENENLKFKNFFKLKFIVFALFIGIMGLLAIKQTVAWLTFTTPEVVNTFTAVHISSEVNETFDNTIKSDVNFTNTGTADAYIRVALLPQWKVNKEPYEEIAPINASLEQCDIEWGNMGSDWFIGTDGYYYCKAIIGAGANTPILVKELQVKNEYKQNGYVFELQILVSAIQAIPKTAVEEAWSAIVVDPINNQLKSR